MRRSARNIAILLTGTALSFSGPRQAYAQQQADRPAKAGAKSVTVYESDFTKPAGDEWSTDKHSQTPKTKDRFLGEFAKEKVTLALDKLPEHKYLRISFQLILIRSWDGEHGQWGPDTWRVDIEPGPVLLETSFGYGEVPGSQAYPDERPAGRNPMETGAKAVDSLGYVYSSNRSPADAVYEMSFAIPHRDRGVRVNFAAVGNTLNVQDEAWGLDDVKVEVLDGPPKALSDDELTNLWRRLGNDDPVRANQAKWDLTASGEPAAEFLRRKLGRASPTKLDAKLVQRLLSQLDHEDWRERQSAADRLVELGPAVKPAVESAGREAKSAEVRLRAQRIASRLENASKPTEDLRILRARRALQLLEWVKARDAAMPDEGGDADGAAPRGDRPNAGNGAR